VAQLYPPALGSLFVASYDSQGYGEVILTRLQMGVQGVMSQQTELLLAAVPRRSNRVARL
jgi:hypothetical protein